jgi:hypothetical protein
MSSSPRGYPSSSFQRDAVFRLFSLGALCGLGNLIIWYRSKVFAWAKQKMSHLKQRLGQGWGLFRSDCREGAVFSRFVDGGNPWPQADARGTAGGGRTPPSKNRRKDQPGRLGTKEKVPGLPRSVGPIQTLLNVTAGFDGRQGRGDRPCQTSQREEGIRLGCSTRQLRLPLEPGRQRGSPGQGRSPA